MPTTHSSHLSSGRSRSRLSRCGLPAAALAVAMAPALIGCGTDRVVSSSTSLTFTPPQILTTQPAPRATGVPYDTAIWVDFATAMDASTLTTRSVFLKLDTQRIDISLAWDPGLQRLRITPAVRLLLRRTYTVELGSTVKAADGSSFGPSGWFFQFTTNGARVPAHPRPPAGAIDESPFASMLWDSTESTAGNISYEVWVGTDSTAVSLRAGTPLVTTRRPYWLPTAAWGLGQKYYWAITVVNATIPERFDGPVQSFTTLPPGTPTDSLIVRGDDSGFNQIVITVSRVNPFQTCTLDTIGSSPGTQAWMRFTPILLPADVKLASARLDIHTTDAYAPRIPTTDISVWSSLTPWPAPCQSGLQFPDQLPVRDQQLAVGRLESGARLIYMSDLLTSFVEASVRHGGFYGFELFSNRRVAYPTPRFFAPSYHPYLKIHYFRTPQP